MGHCVTPIIKGGRDKFASRSRRCIFVGYPYGKKGWKLFDLEEMEIFVSRDVEFVESTFPIAENSLTPQEHDNDHNVGNFEDIVEDVCTSAIDHGPVRGGENGSEPDVDDSG